MLACGALILITLIVYRLMIVLSGHSLMDLWSSGRIRALPAGTEALVQAGSRLVNWTERVLPFSAAGGLLAFSVGLLGKDRRARLLGIFAVICSCVAWLMSLQIGLTFIGL